MRNHLDPTTVKLVRPEIGEKQVATLERNGQYCAGSEEATILACFGLVAQRHSKSYEGFQTAQYDRLIATQTRALVDRMRVEAPILQIGFGASDEKSLGLMQPVEPGEIDIPPIHHIEAARLEDHQVEDIHVVQLAIRDVDERRDVASQVEQGMQLDRRLFLAEARPRKQRLTQIDGSGVESVGGLLQIYPEPVLGIELAGHTDERVREILIDAPIAVLVGIGQCARAILPRMPRW